MSESLTVIGKDSAELTPVGRQAAVHHRGSAAGAGKPSLVLRSYCRDHVAQTILTSEPWTKTGR